MSNRIYQIVAIATLVGAPIVVHVISNALPDATRAARGDGEDAQPSPQDAPTQTAAVAAAPQTQLQPLQEIPPPSTDPVVEAAPSLDTQGISPEAPGFASDTPPPPMPPRPVHKPVTDDDVGPPPPRKPDWMNR
jgi:hypothetical protein